MKIGEVVISICGRDMGEWYVVYRVENEYVFLIDGKHKSVQNPKKKKIKHILQTNFLAEEIAQKISQGQHFQDAQVRKTLKFFKKQY